MRYEAFRGPAAADQRKQMIQYLLSESKTKQRGLVSLIHRLSSVHQLQSSSMVIINCDSPFLQYPFYKLRIKVVQQLYLAGRIIEVSQSPVVIFSSMIPQSILGVLQRTQWGRIWIQSRYGHSVTQVVLKVREYSFTPTHLLNFVESLKLENKGEIEE